MTMSNDQRRERMAHLMELMQDECRRRELPWADEMASIITAWMAGALRHPDGSIARRMLDGEMPMNIAGLNLNIPRSKAPAQNNRAIKEAPKTYTPRVGSKNYRRGMESALNGDPRDHCLMIAPQGGHRNDWLAGYDCVINNKETEQ